MVARSSKKKRLTEDRRNINKNEADLKRIKTKLKIRRAFKRRKMGFLASKCCPRASNVSSNIELNRNQCKWGK
jgi:hypothetical protein